MRASMHQIENMLRTDAMYDILWDVGTIVRRGCRNMCNQVVYSTPPSKEYQRTGYLKTAIYVTTKIRNDRAEIQSTAYALAEHTYPGRASNPQTYKMIGFQPHTANASVKISAGAIYADDVEYGGGNNAGARPFMRAGADSVQRDVISRIESGVASYARAVNGGKARHTFRDKTTGRFAKRP